MYLLQVPPLTTTNYISWAIKVEAQLDAQGLWGVVAPAENAVVDAGKSKMARAMLLGALSEEVLLPVSTKPTAKELRMADGDDLDSFAGKLGAMTARYAGLGAVLNDAALVKKMLDTVPDRLYPVVARIEQFCDVETMAFEEALGRLKAFEERTKRHRQDGGRRDSEELLYTVAQWQARLRRQGGGGYNNHDNDGSASTASGGGSKRRGRCYRCGERGHFKRECPELRKAPAAEGALLANAGVEDDGLL
ncbi:hypothetical protein VPH35_018704 [Triticum aestivum]